ncbi:TonB-dependent receptor [Chitinophaga sp. LS1]|uniref:SusC/RagA family TonB-linked outer membrane protein n=1 Tax=Chitinophaga sp. LS1 TaxID=3051176 RepID=UPI002AAB1EBA|nr:TonB-dependent receptor [Chitinophaga sp. LS1]WPV70043.1 TonB-dependent receptor [Chitinophaga sp. LS1]
MEKQGRRVMALLLPFMCCVLILLSCLQSFAATIPITGKVTDEKGQPLPGVSVQLKGTGTGVSTGTDGTFSINVPDQYAVLVFSYVGYGKQEVPVGGQKHLTVKLASSESALSEVVVVGYGTQQKGNILGAVTTMPVGNLIEKPLGRAEQALIGQMPGVQVKQQTGMPGQGLSITIRGSGSVTAGTEPLYVVDGFPLDVVSNNGSGGFTASPLNNLNPNDIESIQVLKDAAAGAIYGSRAANGVVIITTKRGQSGKAKIAFNATTGLSKINRKTDVLSADEWVKMATEVANTNWVASGSGRSATQTNAERASILGLASGVVNTSYMTDDRWAEPGHPGLTYIDWQDEIFRTAPFGNYEVSASGGTDNVHYFISGNYLDQDGTVINSSFKNYGARANVEANVGKHVKVGLNLAPSYSENHAPDAEGKDNQVMKALQMVPVVESTAGNMTGAGGLSTYTWASAKLISPYAYLKKVTSLVKTTRLLGSMYGQYEIIPGLVLKSTINLDQMNLTTKRYIPDDVVVGAATELVTNPGKNASGSYGGYLKQNFINENTLTYSKTIAGKHNISAVLGESYNKVHYETFTIATAGGFANDIIQTLNNAIPNSSGVTTTGSTTETNNVLYSWFGRVQYDYAGKYLVTASLRKDASSRFGADSRWGTFPSASIGWRLSEEPFLKSVSFINDLKVRVSWGKSGNNNIGDYGSIPTLTSATYSFGGNSATAATGQVVSGLANPNLKWETSSTWNAGIDGSFLRSRLNVIVDVYRKKNTDLLLNLPVVGASGFTTSLQNIGAVQNQGLEIGVNSVNVRLKKFEWSTNANIAFNQNKVLELGADGEPIEISSAYSGSNAPYLLKKGLPLFSYYVTKVNGLLTQADIDNSSVARVSKERVGDAKYYDANGDGAITSADRVVYGQPNPKYTWGLTNTFKYKDFDLGVTIYGQHGGSILSYLGRAIDFSGSTTANTLGVWRDRYTDDNQNFSAPRGKAASTYTVPNVTSDWIYSTDFWRIQNITLGYNLKHILRTSAISSARITASLQNWFGHDKYKGGANPEAQNTNTSGNTSYSLPGDYGAVPLSKSAVIGLNVTF